MSNKTKKGNSPRVNKSSTKANGTGNSQSVSGHDKNNNPTQDKSRIRNWLIQAMIVLPWYYEKAKDMWDWFNRII